MDLGPCTVGLCNNISSFMPIMSKNWSFLPLLILETKKAVSFCDTKGQKLLATQGDIGKEKRVKWGNSFESEVVIIKEKIKRINSF